MFECVGEPREVRPVEGEVHVAEGGGQLEHARQAHHRSTCQTQTPRPTCTHSSRVTRVRRGPIGSVNTPLGSPPRQATPTLAVRAQVRTHSLLTVRQSARLPSSTCRTDKRSAPPSRALAAFASPQPESPPPSQGPTARQLRHAKSPCAETWLTHTHAHTETPQRTCARTHNIKRVRTRSEGCT